MASSAIRNCASSYHFLLCFLNSSAHTNPSPKWCGGWGVGEATWLVARSAGRGAGGAPPGALQHQIRRGGLNGALPPAKRSEFRAAAPRLSTAAQSASAPPGRPKVLRAPLGGSERSERGGQFSRPPAQKPPPRPTRRTTASTAPHPQPPQTSTASQPSNKASTPQTNLPPNKNTPAR